MMNFEDIKARISAAAKDLEFQTLDEMAANDTYIKSDKLNVKRGKRSESPLTTTPLCHLDTVTTNDEFAQSEMNSEGRGSNFHHKGDFPVPYERGIDRENRNALESPVGVIKQEESKNDNSYLLSSVAALVEGESMTIKSKDWDELTSAKNSGNASPLFKELPNFDDSDSSDDDDFVMQMLKQSSSTEKHNTRSSSSWKQKETYLQHDNDKHYPSLQNEEMTNNGRDTTHLFQSKSEICIPKLHDSNKFTDDVEFFGSGTGEILSPTISKRLTQSFSPEWLRKVSPKMNFPKNPFNWSQIGIEDIGILGSQNSKIRSKNDSKDNLIERTVSSTTLLGEKELEELRTQSLSLKSSNYLTLFLDFAADNRHYLFIVFTFLTCLIAFIYSRRKTEDDVT